MPDYRGSLLQSKPLYCPLSARTGGVVGHNIDKRISNRKPGGGLRKRLHSLLSGYSLQERVTYPHEVQEYPAAATN